MSRLDAYLFLCQSLAAGAGLQGPERMPPMEQAVDRVNWRAVIETASYQLVSPALQRSFSQTGLLGNLPVDIQEYFTAMYTLNRDRNRHLMGLIRETTRLLTGAGVETILLKGGAGLLTGLYPDPAMRVLTDIDLLVKDDQASTGATVLETAGFEKMKHTPASHHHAPLARPKDIATVELHWEAVGRRFSHLIPAQEVWLESQPLSDDNRMVRVPSCFHAVLHNIIHAYLPSAVDRLDRVPLRGLFDLALLRNRFGSVIDWTRLLERLDRHQHGTVLREYLWICRCLFGQQMPAGIEPDPDSGSACQRLMAQKSRPLPRFAGHYGARALQTMADPKKRRRLLRKLLRAGWYQQHLRNIPKMWRAWINQ